MPKTQKESTQAFLARMLQAFPQTFRADLSVLFCLHCETKINATQLFQVKQHIATQKHIDAKLRKEKKQVANQTLLTQIQPQSTTGPKLSHFNMQLTKSFLCAGVPLHKISHPSIQEFITEFTSFSAPSESALRKTYVPNLYQECLQKLREKAADNFIWITLDETTDVEQRYVVNFVFGILGVEEEKGRCYLLSMQILEATNSNTIATFFNESLNLLWPNGMYLNLQCMYILI